MHAFPRIEKSFTAPPSDGIIFKTPVFCNRNFNNKCVEFYNKNENILGYHRCPYGFVTHVKNINGEVVVITGLNIKEHSNRKNIQKRETKKESIPLLTKSDFERILKRFSLYTGAYLMEKNKNRENQSLIKKASFESKLITNTLHELRKLNKQIKIQSEYLRNEIGSINCKKNNCDRSKLEDRSYNIFSTSQLVTTRLNAYDFTVNPSLSQSIRKQRMVVFKKFEKAYHCLELSAKNKDVEISLLGNSKFEMQSFKIFELLPFILLENAVKYSPKNREVYCTFLKGNIVEIRNYGPKPSEKDLTILLEKEKRSSAVKMYEGTGLGLYLAKLICEHHDIGISLSLGDNSEFVESEEFCEFIVRLELNQSA